MRKVEELISIVSAYRLGDVDLFKELSTDELWVCINHFDAYIKSPGQAGTWWYERQDAFMKEVSRRIIEDRDGKLNELGI
jgi:hypothetical protein